MDVGPGVDNGARRPSATLQPLSFQAGVPTVPPLFAEEDDWPREDGTVARGRPPEYGAEWTALIFGADEILQADPDYQFLVMVAGAANTGVESLYRSEGVRQVAQQAEGVARAAGRAASVVRQLWEPYRDVANVLEDFNAPATEGGGRDAYLTMTRGVMYTLAGAYQAQLVAARPTLRQYLIAANADGSLSPAAVGQLGVPTKKEFIRAARKSAESLLWLSTPDAPDPPIAPPDFITALRTALGPDTKKRIVARLREQARQAARNEAPLDLFLLATLEVTAQRVTLLPARAGYLRAENDEAVVGPPPPLDPDAPGAAGPGFAEQRRPSLVWLDWIETVLQEWISSGYLPESAMNTPEFALLHSLAAGYVSAGQREMASTQSGERAALQRATRTFQQAVNDTQQGTAQTLRWVRGQLRELGAEAEETAVPTLGGKAQEETVEKTLGGLARALRGLQDTNPSPGDDYSAFLAQDGDVRMAEAFREATQTVRDLRQQESRMRERIDEAVERGVAPLLPPRADIPQAPPAPPRRRRGPRAGWALQPRFTGRISLSAPTAAAINNAYSDASRWLPGLVPRGLAVDRVLRALKHTPGLAQQFANLVASHLLEASIQFPRQWQLEKALPRAQSYRISVMLRMSSWTWGSSAPFDTGEVGASSPGTAGSGPWSGASIAGRLGPGLHPAEPPAPLPEPLRLTGSAVSGTALLSSSSLQAESAPGRGRQRSRTVFESGKALGRPSPSLPSLGGGWDRDNAEEEEEEAARRPSKRSRNQRYQQRKKERRDRLVAAALAWTPHDIRRAVLDAAKRTVYSVVS